jgi:RNA polymerase sigma factor (sigma-70 family)
VETFEEFFRDQYGSLVALGMWMTGDRSIGEDLAQEAMKAAADRWEEVAAYEVPYAFTRRVLINLASNERRRRRRELSAVRRVALEPRNEGAVVVADPLWDAVAGLPRRQRAAIGLRYLCDLPTDAIAEVLGCSESTVRVHLHRAHRRLAAHLGVGVGASTDPGAIGATP